MFSNKDTFKDAVKDYALQTRKNLKIKKNDKTRAVVKCVPKCPFYMRIAKTPIRPVWQLVSFCDEHNCCRTGTNRNEKSYWLAKQFMHILRHSPNIKILGFVEEAKVRWGITVGRHKAYRAKVKSLDMIHGASIQQDHHLRNYGEELLRSTPGSTVIIKSSVCRTGPDQMVRPV